MSYKPGYIDCETYLHLKILNALQKIISAAKISLKFVLTRYSLHFLPATIYIYIYTYIYMSRELPNRFDKINIIEQSNLTHFEIGIDGNLKF